MLKRQLFLHLIKFVLNCWNCLHNSNNLWSKDFHKLKFQMYHFCITLFTIIKLQSVWSKFCCPSINWITPRLSAATNGKRKEQTFFFAHWLPEFSLSWNDFRKMLTTNYLEMPQQPLKDNAYVVMLSHGDNGNTHQTAISFFQTKNLLYNFWH